MSDFDIKTVPATTDRFVTIRNKVQVLVDYFRSAGKAPSHLQVYAGDFRYLQTTINARLRKEAKAKERAENEQRRARKVKEKATVAPDRVEGLFFDGIPLQSHGYSRPRKVEA